MNIFVSIASLPATFLRSSLYGAVSRMLILQERLAHLVGFGVHFPLGKSCQLTHGVHRAVEIVVALQVAFAAPIVQ